MTAIALMVGLTSCNNETTTTTEPTDGAAANLKINFVQTNGSTRAFDNVSQGNLADAYLWVLNSAGTVIKKQYYNTITSSVTIATTTAAKSIVIVGNLGAEANYADLAAATSLTALKAVKIQNIATTPLWVSGQGGVNSVSATSLEATVQLGFVASRIDVTVTNNMTDKSAVDAIEIKDVSVINSAGYSGVVGTANVFVTPEGTIAPYYNSGLTSWINMTAGSSQLRPFFNTPWTGGATLEQSYYTFNGTSKHVIVTVRGTWPTDASIPAEVQNTDFFYSVHFDAAHSRALESGKRYTITINLKGSASYNNGGSTGGGDPDPETPVDNANVTVTVNPADWDVAVPLGTVDITK